MNARQTAERRLAKRVASRVYWRNRCRTGGALYIPLRFLGSQEVMGRRREFDGTIGRYDRIRFIHYADILNSTWNGATNNPATGVRVRLNQRPDPAFEFMQRRLLERNPGP